MKKRRIYFYTIFTIIFFICTLFAYVKLNAPVNYKKVATVAYKEPENTPKEEPIIWDGLTEEELATKLDKNLYHELAGTGKYFAAYTAKTGLDPYLAVSIVNLETGCKWKCSYLARVCHNIGGMKGRPHCGSGSYAKVDSLEEGIESYLNLLYKGYWSKGLTTAKKMNSKYAESSTWADKVNRYYETIKAS